MTSEAICSGAEATCEGNCSRSDPAVNNRNLREEKVHKPRAERLRENGEMAWRDKVGGYWGRNTW